jgi:GNAT superfamily N-acetyltransferase
MAGVVQFDALGQKAFAATLAAPGEGGPATFCAHARAKTVLPFPRSFRSLVGAFHRSGWGRGAPKVRTSGRLSICSCDRHCHDGQSLENGHVSEKVAIEPATEHDLDELSRLLGELFSHESDFRPNKDKQLRGLRLIFEQPNRGRVFVLRRNNAIVGMINLLFTISTAEGGFVMLLEDLVVHDEYRGKGYGSMLLEHAVEFARQKNFLRITLLTDRPELRSQALFRRFGFHESSMMPMRLLLSTSTSTTDQPPASA